MLHTRARLNTHIHSHSNLHHFIFIRATQMNWMKVIAIEFVKTMHFIRTFTHSLNRSFNTFISHCQLIWPILNGDHTHAHGGFMSVFFFLSCFLLLFFLLNGNFNSNIYLKLIVIATPKTAGEK